MENKTLYNVQTDGSIRLSDISSYWSKNLESYQINYRTDDGKFKYDLLPVNKDVIADNTKPNCFN